VTIEAALFREQNVNVAVVVVKPHVLDNPVERNKALRGLTIRFPGYQVVLMGQDSLGHPNYFGRQDVARFLSRTPLQALPFKRYHFN
jgi:hypothetical protein